MQEAGQEMDLQGRVVIVSHADTDHGAALARAICTAGAAAILSGEQFNNMNALAAQLHDDTGAPIVVFAGDLTRDDERQVLAEMLTELFPV